MVGYTAVPAVVNRLGEVKTIIATRVTTFIISFLFPMSLFYLLSALLFIAFRTLAMFTMPVRQSFATELAEPSETASLIGISSSARMGIRSLAPALTGYMFQMAQFSAPFLIGGTFLAINSLLYRSFFHKKEGLFASSMRRPK